MPFRILYGMSDITYFIAYYIIRYRRKIVFENLRNAFPEKSDKELEKISKSFYSYLCDLIVETIKNLTISKKASLARCKIKDVDVFEKLYSQNKNIILVIGHFGNWEWAGYSLSLSIKHQSVVIYKPLSNKYFNQFIYKIRTRLGAKLIPMNDTFREMVNNKDNLNVTTFIADQTPPPDGAYWTNFLNQDTPIFQGTEKIAKKLNYPVIFMSVNRLNRGYYEVSAEMLCENPANTSDGEISELHTRMLEKEIRKNPQFWLWSHRRWKHKR